MCTAITYHNSGFYFGRTLDYERSFGEEVVLTPRNFPLPFRQLPAWKQHHAILGMAHVADGYPLYYDAMNEKGLCMAGLNFVGFARYVGEGQDKVAPFELLPWVLGQCEGVGEAERLLETLNLTNEPYNKDLPATPLHWMISDQERSIVVEATEEGLQVYENPVGVLTNNPPFPFHLKNLAQYLNLTAEVPKNRFSETVDLQTFSRGMGAFGLPGDLSSPSRFIRAAFVKTNSLSKEGESVSQFFHILGAVEQQRGCVRLGKGKNEVTIYSSCCDLERGIYYYKTYENHSITAVELGQENLERNDLIIYPMKINQEMRMQNQKG